MSVKRDKKIIDLFLRDILDDKINSPKLEDIGFINKNDFEEQLNRVLGYKEKLNSEIIPILTDNNPVEINLPDPIILEKLSLINIGQFNKIELDLSKRITCIIGSNGIGKTTILRAIAVGLVGFGIDEDGVLDTDVEAIQHLLRVKGAKIDGSIIYSESGRIRLDYRIKGKSYSNPILINLQEDGSLAFKDGDTDNEKPSFNAMNGASFKSLVLGYSQTITQEKNNDKKPGYAPTFKDVEALIYNNGSNQFSGLKEWIIDLDGEIGKRKQKNEPTKRLQEALDLIFNAVSGITESKIQFTGTEGLKKYLWVGIDDKEPILFSLLSQGYKKVFAWVGHFVRRIYEAYEKFELKLQEAPAIILIDEVDTYLHPVWQKNILNVMSKMFPNVRFIITTHSPLVVTHLEELEDSSIIIIDKDGAKTLKTVYGKQISSAFNLLMGIDERAKEVQGKLNILFEELEEESPEVLQSVREKLDELLKILGDKDPDMTQAEAMYDYLKSIS